MTFNELKDKLFANYESGAIKDDQLVQIVEQASHYLNLQTLTEYAKSENISYNAAKKRHNHIVIVGSIKFIINNE